MFAHLVALAATPAPGSGAGSTTSALSEPIFILSVICALAGVCLLVFDGLIRWRGASSAIVILNTDPATIAAMDDQQKKIYEEAIAAYKDLFKRFPQLVAGVTLVVIPLFIVGGISFGGVG